MTKNLLVIAVAGLVIGLAFVTGIVNVQNAVALYATLPLGAVCLGLFLLFRILEKEVALYDEEQHVHPAFKDTAAVSAEDCDCSQHAHGKHATSH